MIQQTRGHRTDPYKISPPAMRKLWIYSIDPSLAGTLETAMINRATVEVPWMDNPDPLKGTGPDKGPIGQYLEVIDLDPASGYCYEPVNLDDPFILAKGGLEPSDGNPQFHQQMVYAVAMLTIKNFERALGRAILWSPHGKAYVPRLRIYPHALREANAYYSPSRKALLFGYFPAAPSDPGGLMPGGMVFSCLSHDIVAHETTHALLDGTHGQYLEPSNPDVLAFHEAFADIVAIFQHFTFKEVVRHQIARVRGDMGVPNLLGELAVEFGKARGRSGALRSAIEQEADPTIIDHTFEPHARGALLVAAVFDAFRLIYQRRTSDLLRIATDGRGILPEGDLHPDLVNRLAKEAARTAKHVMTICVRALDYLPPMDLTFGDYLRALITADYDLVPNDDLGYRVAFIEAFRRRGIYPKNVRSLSMESLLWRNPKRYGRGDQRLAFAKDLGKSLNGWNPSSDREAVFDEMNRARRRVEDIFRRSRAFKQEVLTGLKLRDPELPFKVPSIRPVRRMGPDGQLLTDVLFEVTHQLPGDLDKPFQTVWREAEATSPQAWPHRLKKRPDFWFRGGCTVIVDQSSGEIRHCIYRKIYDPDRYEQQREFIGGGSSDPDARQTFFGAPGHDRGVEVFSLLHKSTNGEVL